MARSFWEPRGSKIIANKTFHISNIDSVESFQYSLVNFTHVKHLVLFYVAGTTILRWYFVLSQGLFFFVAQLVVCSAVTAETMAPCEEDLSCLPVEMEMFGSG